ncbi:hypothetical protein PHISP_04339 [Aspergillus sp. HF37]|nr:hypothetical protein PHISP_04339 [Aspergillus sp. HF37]
MLTLKVDGKRYKVPVLDPLMHTRGSHDDWLSYKARRDAEAGLDATTSRKSGLRSPQSRMRRAC